MEIKRADFEQRVSNLRETYAQNQQDAADSQAAEDKARSILEKTKSSGKTSNAQKEACQKNLDLISKELIAEVNKIFYKDSPNDLIMGLEPLTAILRNKMSANNVDVEVYFKNPENLLAKLNRMEMRDANSDVIVSKLEMLKKAKPSFEREAGEGEISLHPFIPLIDWGIAFCEGAQVEIDIKAKEDDLKAAEKANKKIKAMFLRTRL